ncbi:hypothetical protein PHMEG_0008603 [Phytophthora megakarya]|uniref:Uncharacterized protein n=1 Tax=Phytophthora megakarya TaxID=4795 RepID=A0A225WIK2_9STRA|nr:hypothetical protein PHMEG_0008603 [Phytophthora megakarya]
MLWELYETNCTNLDIALVYIVDGKCHTFTDWGIKVTLNANNSITVLQTTDNTCSHLDQINSVSWNLPRSLINTDECSEEYGRVYSNAEIGSNITTGNSSIAAASFVAPIIAILLSVVAQTLFAL